MSAKSGQLQYADRLTFLDDRTRTRRDHEKYLTLIDTITLLHQHQREVKTAAVAGRSVQYIKASLEDIAQANAIAHEVLGRSLDELPPQTRRLLGAIVAHVHELMRSRAVLREQARFTRKQLREATGWGDTQLRVHLERLVGLEYLIGRNEGAGGRFTYELLFDGDAASAVHLSGLIDVASLRDADQAMTTTVKSRGDGGQVAGRTEELAVRSRAESGPVAARSRVTQTPQNPALARVLGDEAQASGKTRTSEAHALPVMSYPKAAAASFLAAASVV